MGPESSRQRPIGRPNCLLVALLPAPFGCHNSDIADDVSQLVGHGSRTVVVLLMARSLRVC